MTAGDLERRYRRLLALFPRRHRAEYGPEMLAALLAGAEQGRRRPRMREVVDLAGAALAAHAVARLGRSQWSAAAGAVGTIGAIGLTASVLRNVGLWHAVFDSFAPMAGWGLALVVALLVFWPLAAVGAVAGRPALATVAAALGLTAQTAVAVLASGPGRLPIGVLAALLTAGGLAVWAATGGPALRGRAATGGLGGGAEAGGPAVGGGAATGGPAVGGGAVTGGPAAGGRAATCGPELGSGAETGGPALRRGAATGGPALWGWPLWAAGAAGAIGVLTGWVPRAPFTADLPWLPVEPAWVYAAGPPGIAVVAVSSALLAAAVLTLPGPTRWRVLVLALPVVAVTGLANAGLHQPPTLVVALCLLAAFVAGLGVGRRHRPASNS
ncbi:hypothetical protein [Asanoa siamensis]|uniref:Uncharacterized protein n=1 Tax=Asanoa siamensis TaxID=926357 RepID=A0ABQ4D2R9_9ACTN|nr:hypothetical protein [Asanoa siamensis]GIF77573.1 hypothetical protein Asi02nite_70910 [Asanoa siamensis]